MMYLLSNSTFPCSIVNSKEKGWDKGWSGVCKGSSVKGQGGGGGHLGAFEVFQVFHKTFGVCRFM